MHAQSHSSGRWSAAARAAVAAAAVAIGCAQAAQPEPTGGGGSGDTGVPGDAGTTGQGTAGTGAGQAGTNGAGQAGTNGAGQAGTNGTGTGGRGGGAGTVATTGTAGTGTGTAGRGGTTGTGTAGTTGAAGTGPMCASEMRAPAAGGANFPFPQVRLTANCAYPAYCASADANTAWTKWKGMFVVDGGSSTLRVQVPSDSNNTYSEGIGYGMLGAVYMNDKTTFDKLWAYEQRFLDGNQLMNWKIGPSGSVVAANSASDGDEDMAFALMMADKQWGGTYATTAKTLLGKIIAHEVDNGNNFIPGDNGFTNKVNPSFLAPAYYRAFAEYDTANTAKWTAVLNQSYTVLNACANGTTGLVPQYCSPSGQAMSDTHYQYDAARTPFRIALDACWNNEARAITYLAKISAFFSGKGAGSIVDGYNLDGSASGTSPSALVFVGPAVISGMPGKLQSFIDSGYNRVGQLVGGTTGYDYYNGAWGFQSLLFMTGNFVNYLHP
jgi:endo-1,4-beta-D-glucanase Y